MTNEHSYMEPEGTQDLLYPDLIESQEEPDNSVWTKLIIFFNPLASIIFYLLSRDNDPIRAKKALSVGWFAVIFWTIVSLFILAAYLIVIFISLSSTLAMLNSLS